MSLITKEIYSRLICIGSWTLWTH